MGNTFRDLAQVCQESLNQEITKLKAGAIGNQKGAQKCVNSVLINLMKNSHSSRADKQSNKIKVLPQWLASDGAWCLLGGKGCPALLHHEPVCVQIY